MQLYRALRVSTILIVSVFVFSGCDAINSIKDYFNKSKKIVSAEISTPTAPENGSNETTESMAANVLVRVGNWSMTIDEFNDRLKALKEVVPDYNIDDPQSKQLVLEELIRQQIIVSDAEKTGLANEKDIKEAVDEFRRTIIVREAVRRLTESVTVSDEEAQVFYDSQKDLMVEPEQWKVSEIVVDTQEKANTVLRDILGGSDFSEMAKQNSVSESAKMGGDLGYLSEAPFQEMATALLPLEVGGVSSVFKGPNGKFYIAKVVEKKAGKPLAFEEIKSDIVQNQIIAKQQEIILNKIEELKKSLNIQINKDLLN